MSRRKVKLKPKFYLYIFLIVLLGIGAAVVALRQKAGGVLKTGAMDVCIEEKAVLIRDEMSISVDKYDHVRFLVKEGATVFEGMPVAEVYKWGYSDDMTQSLLNTESQIYAAQKLRLSGVENTELMGIELQIEQKQAAIRAALTGSGEEDTLALQNELNSLMQQRADYLKNAVQPTEELSRLYTSQMEKQTQLSSYKTDISAVKDGMVSFYFDGFELVLNKDKLDTVNAALVKNTVNGNVDSLGGASNNLLYRIVEPNHWYAAFVTQQSQNIALCPGENYTLAFEGYEGTEFEALAMETVYSTAGILNMLEINADMGALVNSRVIKVKAKNTVEGLIIPLEGITYKEGISYVIIEGSTGPEEIRVDVIASDEEQAVIRPHDENAVLSAGMRYKKP